MKEILVGDVSSRLLALRKQILAGETSSDQEEELGRLIASALFSRLENQSVARRKNDAIQARRDAVRASASKSLAITVDLLEEAAI
jgi:hypothetical protein